MPSETVTEVSELLQRMSPRIADLLLRMMELDALTLEDVRPFRDEIVLLNHSAQTDEEQSALLFAFLSLMDRVEGLGLDDGTLDTLRDLRRADYLMMLNVQALVGDLIDPDRLEVVTLREVEAGRMAADDDFRQFAVAGAAVLGKPTVAPRAQGLFRRLFGKR